MSVSAERFFEAEEAGPFTIDSSWGEVTLLSWCHPHRKPNQDACLCLDLKGNGLVLAVADGMGGHSQGELAARLTLEALEDCVVESIRTGGGLRVGVMDGFEAAQAQVHALGSGAGTTLVVATIDGEGMRSFHTGDSMALLTGGRGLIKHQSLDHSPTAYALRAGLIKESEVLAHPERHVLLSAIGHPGLQIDVGPAVPLAVKDSLLLASDGLTDNLLGGAIIRLMKNRAGLKACAALAAKARTKMMDEGGLGKLDDLTMVLFRPRART